jgi:SAM-dependent methyltransferase
VRRSQPATRRVAEDDPPFAYGRIADLYDTGFRLLGFKRGVEQFLDRVTWRLPARARILDAGAGTGIMGLWFLRRFPEADVIAFDIDRRMLAVLGRSARRLSTARGRLVVAHGDLRLPDVLTRVDTGQSLRLVDGSFDAVIVGAALEHVPLDASVGRLARLLRSGGVFLNLGVRPGPTATVLSRVYRFRPYTTDEVRRSLQRLGFADIQVLRLAATDFPANLTRIGVMARKP